MSENVFSSNEDLAHLQESISQISAGSMMRNAREAEGMHIAALAGLLKVPVRKLEALEADRFDLLPDTIFVRALAASVCRTLKIESAAVLEKLPYSTVPSLKMDESGINMPFRASGDSFGLSFLQQFSKPLVLAVLALLLGVVAIVFFPMPQRVGVASAPKTDAAFVLPAQSVTSSESENPAKTQVFSPSLLPAVSETAVAINPAFVASSTSLPSAVLNTLPVIVPGSGATTGVVVFKANGTSWVEVIDASKVVQVRKTMTNGEIVGASGVMPLSIVVGRSDTTEVQVRGKPFDLASIAKDNVARFEVK